MTRIEVNALEKARALLGAMPGWQLSDRTIRNINEEDSNTRRYAEIVNPAIPGAVVSLSTSREPGRLAIDATYPHGGPRIEGRGRVLREEITVSALKSAAEIARDIERRLFRDTDYFAHVTECNRQKAQEDADRDAAQVLAFELARMAGAQLKSEGFTHREPTDDERRRFRHWPGSTGASLDVEVSYNGTKVKIELADVSPQDARELIGWWNTKQARRKAREA